MVGAEGSLYLDLPTGAECPLSEKAKEVDFRGVLIGEPHPSETHFLFLHEIGDARNYHTELIADDISREEIVQAFEECPCHSGQKVGKACLAITKLKSQGI